MNSLQRVGINAAKALILWIPNGGNLESQKWDAATILPLGAEERVAEIDFYTGVSGTQPQIGS